MSQVSKIHLDKDVALSVTSAFEQVLTSISSSDQAVAFMSGLLTPTERIMLPKRLAVALLIRQGKKYNEIKDLLKVSQGTIAVISRYFSQQPASTFNKLLDTLLKDKKINNFLEDLLGTLITSPIPPKGANWSIWRKNQWHQKLAQEKRKKTPF